jgi:hypothetical protein
MVPYPSLNYETHFPPCRKGGRNKGTVSLVTAKKCCYVLFEVKAVPGKDCGDGYIFPDSG